MSEIKNRKLTQEEKDIIRQDIHMARLLPLKEPDRTIILNSSQILDSILTLLDSNNPTLEDLLNYYLKLKPILKAHNKLLDEQIKTTYNEKEKEEYLHIRKIVNHLWRWLDNAMNEVAHITLP